MREVKLINVDSMLPTILEIMGEGRRVRITVTGMSMYPFLRGNIDSVELSSINFAELLRGDIVLIKRDNGAYILHRVVHKGKERFFLAGDAQQWIEGPLRPDQLVAKVVTVWRKDSSIPCTAIVWIFLSKLWCWLLPFRYSIIKTYNIIHRLL